VISKHTIEAAVPLGHYEDQGHWEDQGAWEAMETPATVFSYDFEAGITTLYEAAFVASAGASGYASAGWGGRSGSACAVPYVKANETPLGVATATFTKTLTGLTVGRTYRWSMWVNVMYFGYPPYYSTDRVKIGVTGIGATAYAATTTTWTEIAYTFTATATTHLLVITGDETDADATSSAFYLDDMALTATTSYEVNTVWVPDLVWIDTSVPLVVIDASVDLDESWSPYAQARLTCAIPPLASLDAIDPRLGRRIRIRLQQTFGDSEPLSALSAAWAGTTLATQTAALADTFLNGLSATYGHPYNAFGTRASTRRSLDLVLRSREVDHANGTMYLTAASDESLLQDYGLVATTATSAGPTSVRTICAWVLGKVGLVLYPGTADGTVTDSTWLPGVSAWDYLRPLVDAVGLRLWCDDRRNFYLADPIDGTSGGLSISAKYATQATDVIDMERDWYDAVVITYSWRDAAGNDQTAYDTASAAGYSKVLALTYDRPYPGRGAAAAMLSRTLGRGRQQALEAVSDYSAAPGMAITVTLPNTPIQTGLLSAVSWQVPGDEMRLTPRDLIDTPVKAWAYAQAGVAWNEIPVGTDWTEYVYEPVGV